MTETLVYQVIHGQGPVGVAHPATKTIIVIRVPTTTVAVTAPR
jgi:hypothetical protein